MLGPYLYRLPLPTESGALTGEASFTGAGTLTVSATTVATASAAFTGAGSLSVAATVVGTAAPAFTGTGTLTVAATTVATASTAFSGAGTLSINANVIPSNQIIFNGEAHINANAVRVAQAGNIGPMTGEGTVLFAAKVVRKASLSFIGSGTLNVTALEPPDMYTPGPCDTWEPIGSCLTSLNTEAAAFTGTALTAASEILWQLTAQRFGLCRVQLRPCRAACVDDQARSAGWWEFGSYPYPTWIAGTWFNLGCAGCRNGCSCTELQETLLPGPIAALVEVKVDGTVLDPSAYEVHDYRKLVRVDGERWPLCNDFTRPLTETGTWAVTADYGEPVPMTGRIAVGELACEIARSLAGQECALPAGVQQITRQGVSMTFADYEGILNNGLVGLPHSDRFIKTWNPRKLMARSAAFDLDGDSHAYRQGGL